MKENSSKLKNPDISQNRIIGEKEDFLTKSLEIFLNFYQKIDPIYFLEVAIEKIDKLLEITQIFSKNPLIMAKVLKILKKVYDEKLHQEKIRNFMTNLSICYPKIPFFSTILKFCTPEKEISEKIEEKIEEICPFSLSTLYIMEGNIIEIEDYLDKVKIKNI